MPLPKPKPGESHAHWIDRCMANPTMNREYPETGQRRAVCERQWQGSEVGLVAGFTLVDLEALEVAIDKAARVEPSDAPPIADEPVSTLHIASPLTLAILAYQRELLRQYNVTINGLVDVAGNPIANRAGGYQLGFSRGNELAAAGIAGFLAAAAVQFPRAFAIGQDLALRSEPAASHLVASEVEMLLARQYAKNELYVRHSLFADLSGGFQTILRDPALPPPQAAEAMTALGARNEYRATMYATKLWGLGHLGFGTEILAAGKLLNWVLTSNAPCVDCPRLAKQGPYGLLKPLPTMPGLGETECRTNCLCLLVEVKRG